MSHGSLTLTQHPLPPPPAAGTHHPSPVSAHFELPESLEWFPVLQCTQGEEMATALEERHSASLPSYARHHSDISILSSARTHSSATEGNTSGFQPHSQTFPAFRSVNKHLVFILPFSFFFFGLEAHNYIQRNAFSWSQGNSTIPSNSWWRGVTLYRLLTNVRYYINTFRFLWKQTSKTIQNMGYTLTGNWVVFRTI